jgi:hypothetical protein
MTRCDQATEKSRYSGLKASADCLTLTVEHAAENCWAAKFGEIVDNAADADAVPACAVNENVMAADVAMADWKALDEEHKNVDGVAAAAAEAEMNGADGWKIVDVQDEAENALLIVQGCSSAQEALTALVSRVHHRPATVGRGYSFCKKVNEERRST